MAKRKGERISTLDPEFKDKIKDLLEVLNESVSSLYEEATRDHKTKLYNNKFFESILGMEIEKAKRGYQKLCLFIIDIDHFKKVNDTYGHLKGDEILIKMAQVIQKQLRKSDIACRFGGEEFFILLPETDLKKAEKIASRLSNSIKSEKLLKKYNITVSGGLAECKKNDTKKKFIKRADDALYKAKKTGRDRNVVAK